MKIKPLSAAVFACLFCGALAAADAPQRIAVIDMETLVQAHPNTTADKKLLAETMKDFKAQGTSLKEDVEGLKRVFEKADAESRNPALSEKARSTALEEAAKARDAFVLAQYELREKLQSLQDQLTQQELRMLKRTVAELRSMIESYAAENGISVVLDISGKRLGSVPPVVYYAGELDLTDIVLEKIKSLPAGSADVSEQRVQEPGS